jgi:hypothetical protein
MMLRECFLICCKPRYIYGRGHRGRSKSYAPSLKSPRDSSLAKAIDSLPIFQFYTNEKANVLAPRNFSPYIQIPRYTSYNPVMPERKRAVLTDEKASEILQLRNALVPATSNSTNVYSWTAASVLVSDKYGISPKAVRVSQIIEHPLSPLTNVFRISGTVGRGGMFQSIF